MHPDLYKNNNVVRVRISGDGAKYNRNDTFVVMNFNILTGKDDLSSNSKSILLTSDACMMGDMYRHTHCCYNKSQ